MTDTAIDGGSAPVELEAKAPVLKSTDTRTVQEVPAKTEPAKDAAKVDKAPKPEAQAVADDESAPPEGDHAPAAETSERKEQRLPRWMRERLERERRVTEARTREAVLREMQAQRPEPVQRQPEPQGEREKTLEDFDFDPVAYQKYLARQAVEEYKREEQSRVEQTKQAAAADQFKAKIDSFEAKVGAGAWEDIETSVLNQDPAYKPLVDLFLGDEHDLEMAHHLVQNPAEAERLLSMPPLQRVREVAKLAEKFSSASDPVERTVVPPKKTTNAPPPPKTVSGSGKPSVDVRNPEITTADRIKAWKAGRG